MGILWALMGSRSLLAALGVLSLAGAYEGWKYHERMVGEQQIVQASQKTAEAANEKSEAARIVADKPGAADRLRLSACRDCRQ